MPEKRAALDDTETCLLVSTSVDDTFKVFAGYPAAARDDEFAEVVYLTDANGHFGSAVDLLWGLVRAGRVRPALLIGIGYQAGRCRADPAVRRRDLTPPPPGGTSPFLEFIESEVRPWAGRHFRVRSAATTYFGHSLGGLLGLHALLTTPSSFDRYVLSSPSVWWQDYRILAQERDWAATHDDLAATVFLGVGGAERGTATAGRDMVGDVTGFARRLSSRGYPSLRLSSAVFPDEVHETAAHCALSRGLRSMAGEPPGREPPSPR